MTNVIPMSLRGVPTVMLSCVLYAAQMTMVRWTTGMVAPAQLVFIRFVCNLVCVGIWCVATRRWPRFSSPGMWALRGLLGGLGVYLSFVAIANLELGPASLLIYTFPIFATVIAAYVLKEHVERRKILGLVLSFLGASLVIQTAIPAGGTHFGLNIGVLAGIVSAVLMGASQTTMRILRREADAATVFSSFCLFGMLAVMPMAVFEWRPISGALMVPVLGIGVMSFAAQMLSTYALGYASTAAVSGTSLLTPALAWVMGTLFLHERVSTLGIVGTVVCVAGVLLGTVLPASLSMRGAAKVLASEGASAGRSFRS
ncbi:MAG: DMT family transporter [Myxococcaceae bacterium]